MQLTLGVYNVSVSPVTTTSHTTDAAPTAVLSSLPHNSQRHHQTVAVSRYGQHRQRESIVQYGPTSLLE